MCIFYNIIGSKTTRRHSSSPWSLFCFESSHVVVVAAIVFDAAN